jgi:N-acetyl-alpha-D-glucosaminyl L-malate synthase BshA
MVGDGPDLGEAVQRARTLGVTDQVHFLGEQDQVLPLLSISDVFLLPSAQESFGLAALEAMACGVPVIGTAAGGLPEVVEDEKSGYLRPVGDVPSMAKAGLELLRDDALWKRFSAESRRRAEQDFPASVMVGRYRALYEKTLAG